MQLGDTDGFDLLVEFRAAYPALPIVVVSAADQRSDVLRAIDLGAMGFVPKVASNETLFEALRMVMSGGIYVPPTIMRTRREPEATPDNDRRRGPSWGVQPRSGAGPLPLKPGAPLAALGLTPRQTDVLALLLEGQPNKVIARQLNLSVETIKDHVAAVLRILNVSTRTQAVLAISEMSQQANLIAWREARQREPRDK
ncbi:response regulator transcription factor [Piscinibacter koreensis]|uniref:response regulator transcription factor n=1 Tax=Piscinibacter koreensis TaxID=2742824 RepID=UPI001FE82477|nr:response regulator transcription factor [Schlegelella koreensis]